ncbi:MAG: aldehyde dehydrogenase family protein [Beutenbergiaceae bacterium]
MSTSTSYAVADLREHHYSMIVNGNRVDAATGATFTRTAPAHGVCVGRYPQAGQQDVDAAVAAARAALPSWRHTSGSERATLLAAVADHIRDHAEELSLIECAEAGKPIRQARDEVASAAGLWDYAATLARHQYGDAHNSLGADTLALVVHEPVGVVGIITPWNFPLLIVSQKLPFALASGNTAVIKPSEFTPGTTLRLAELALAAGIPAGVLNVVTGAGETGSAITEHAGIDALSFTGSTRVGRLLAGAAGGDLKHVELELGGKNAQIVMADADVEAAADAAVFGGFYNVGQCCNSGSRLLVQRDIAEAFHEAVLTAAATVVVGDPLQVSTDVGAIVNQTQFEVIADYVQQGQQAGARLLLGGTPEPGPYFPPTIFADVSESMSIAQEEIFGPVLSVMAFDAIDDAVRIANGTRYGLSAGIWTANLDAGLTAARDLRAGTVWVNRWMDGYPELPFGGYAASGMGRELGRSAAAAFTELKTIQLQVGPRTSRWLDPNRAK